jgi:hypothetical protein
VARVHAFGEHDAVGLADGPFAGGAARSAAFALEQARPWRRIQD